MLNKYLWNVWLTEWMKEWMNRHLLWTRHWPQQYGFSSAQNRYSSCLHDICFILLISVLIFSIIAQISFFKKKNYLFGCTGSWLWHLGTSIFVEACTIFSYGMPTLSWGIWDLVPWPGLEPWSLHWYNAVRSPLSHFSISNTLVNWGCMDMSAYSLNCVWLIATPWTIACQAPLSMEYSRQEYWSR